VCSITSRFTLEENSIYKNSRDRKLEPIQRKYKAKKRKKRTRTLLIKEHNNQDTTNTIR
jgi:hypothetical protein